MDAVGSYEKIVRTSRLIYDDSVTKLNRDIRMFPVSLIAGMPGFHRRDDQYRRGNGVLHGPPRRVTDQTAFGETALPDGRNYAMFITMQDASGNEAYSDTVTFQCQNVEITTTVYQ